VISVLLWVLAALILAFFVYAHYLEPRQLRLTRRQVAIPRLPAELHGLRIAHLADLHVGGSREDFARHMAGRALQVVLDLQPDLICVTGDLAQASRHIGLAVQALLAVGDRPAYAVMGNHDHDKMLESECLGPPEWRVGREEWTRRVARTGVVVLHNEHVEVALRGRRLMIMGVGDPSCGWDDLAGALAPNPQGDLHLLLVHSPDLVDDPQSDWADLVLCGHTHGGQITLPGIGTPWAPVWRDRRRSEGLFAVGQTICHVTRGVGAGIRSRFRCPPEVCELTLVRGEDPQLRRLPRFPLNGA
jgi:hypothetical protein